MRSLSKTWQECKPNLGSYVPAAALSIVLGVIPITILLWLYAGLLNHSPETTWHYLTGLILKTLSVSLFIPFVMVPISVIVSDPSSAYRISFHQALGSIGKYFRYFGMVLITGLFFIISTVICFGLPGFGSDPILKLVWIVLMNYWLALSLPVPVIMDLNQISSWRAYLISYRYCHDVRWNLYLLGLVLTLTALFGAAMLIIGLTIAIPLMWFAVRDYVFTLVEYKVIPGPDNPSSQD